MIFLAILLGLYLLIAGVVAVSVYIRDEAPEGGLDFWPSVVVGLAWLYVLLRPDPQNWEFEPWDGSETDDDDETT